MELFAASNQWATRPDDERFSSLEELYRAALGIKDTASEVTVPLGKLRTEADNGEVLLVGKKSKPTRLSFTAFGQLATRSQAPATYLRTLPATLAVQNLNHGLAKVPKDAEAALLLHRNGDYIVRALTSERYSRIWHSEVIERLMPLQDAGWVVPPARPCREGQAGSRLATAADVIAWAHSGGGLSIQEGDLIAPAGLYLGQGAPELFVFMVNPSARIKDGTDEGLSRGVFITNSEVGNAAFKVTAFLLRHVCGNHIVWGAKSVKSVSLRHIGDVRERAFQVELSRYLDSSASDEQARIESCKRFVIAADKDAVLDMLFSKGIESRRTLDAAYQLAESNPEDGDPRSAWGMAQGLTRYSQAEAYADKREAIDRAAGKVLDLPF